MKQASDSATNPVKPGPSAPADEMDIGLLRRGDGKLSIVGLGGSAGSITALQEFFAAMPVDSGMAFVVIVHLSPTHVSTLADIFQLSTAMPVVTAADGVTVEPNSVYVIPPGKFLALVDGHLSLTDAQEPRGKRVAVDYFFRMLAESHGAHALAVVFSGAGGDGALGLKRVKELGGLTIAQDPDEAQHPDMPRSAIATGVVDWVLGVKEMPAKLLAYAKQGGELNLPFEDGPHPVDNVALSPDEHEAALRDVLAFLHVRTGRDFACYKRATILRRIERRMRVNGLTDLPGYLAYMRTHAGEAGALLQDLLISVTNFFRDPASFAALERIVPELFTGKEASDTVRVWVAGCATGEEAYSIAMLLCEHAATLVGPPQIQVFATDLDEEVIRQAREGLYPDTIAADVTEARLQNFFIHEQGGYRIRRAVRELVLFAPHDLLKDSPFSRLDLISCRNLLIYLKREAQSRAFDIFHFAMKPGGRLFLGTSEAVDEGSLLFSVFDKKQRIYVQRPGPKRLIDVPAGAGALGRALALQERTRERPTVPGRVTVDNVPARPDLAVPLDSGLTPSELHYRLIERFSPPSILVNSAHEVVHLSETAGRFLQVTGGEPTRNLLRMIHPMLRVELRAALYAAARTHTPATAIRIPLEQGNGSTLVDIRITPAGDLAPDFLLVALDEHAAEAGVPDAAARSADADQVALHLERELVATKAHLRDTIEQSDASTEELKASNEELQAMNEELRSATEELETSREELQSINEELTTVNDELKSNVDRLAWSNNDLQNLMAATDIATVFLDRELRIQRFTPSAKALFNLIPADLGRPLADLSRQLDYAEIVVDAERSLAHLQPVQREVRAGERWYIARTLPYRTADDHIAGVVLTFLDITTHKESENALRASEGKGRSILESISDGFFALDREWRITYVNPAGERFLGRTPGDLTGKVFWDELPGTAGSEFERVYRRVAAAGVAEAFTAYYPNCDCWYEVHAYPAPDGLSVYFRDVTDRKRAEESLQASEARFRSAVGAVSSLIWTNDAQGQMTGEQPGWGNFTGQDFEAYQGYGWSQAVHPDDAQPTIAAWKQAVAEKRSFEFEHRILRRDGEWRTCSIRAVPVLNEDGTIREWVGVHTDITEERRGAEALRKLTTELSEADRRKDEFLATLAHELRNPLAPISNGLQIMRMAGAQGTIEQARLMMERQLVQMTRLVDDLLDASRVTSGKLELRPERIDMRSVIAAALETSRPVIEQNAHDLAVVMPNEPIFVDGDPMRLAQVVSNLLTNSAKYTDRGGHIRLSVVRDDELAVVTVADDGIGIPPEMLETVFGMFAQVDRTLEKTTGGLGIGLSLVKGLVEMHGGTVEARSEGLGRGSEFAVRLPVATTAVSAAQSSGAEAKGTEPTGPRRILIVEDNVDAADSLGQLLEMMGHEVRIAYDGEAGIKAARAFRPDVVLSDIGMPKVNGYDMASSIRAEAWGKAAVLVALSGWSQDADHQRSVDAGFDHHMVKPVEPAALMKLLAGSSR